MGSELGHAKNITNLPLLIKNIKEIGTLYKPSNQRLLVTNLELIYTNAAASHEKLNKLIAPYSLAVDAREDYFKDLSPFLTKLGKAYKATTDITPAQIEDFKAIARKLKGSHKAKPKTEDDDTHKSHSTSRMSYDIRTDNFDLLISLLENTSNYNPSEAIYTVASLKNMKTEMLNLSDAVNNASVPISGARAERNKILYETTDNLVDVANQARDYIFSILDAKTPIYKGVMNIKFMKKR